MTEIATPPAPRIRPAWATALGLLGVVIAATHFIDVGHSLTSMLSSLASDPVAATQPDVYAGLRLIYIGTTCVREAGCVMLLAGAVLLLKQRKSARRVFLIYLALVWGSYLLGVGTRLSDLLRPDAFGHPYAAAGLVNALLNFLDPYPVFYAIWFLRPAIAREMATWR